MKTIIILLGSILVSLTGFATETENKNLLSNGGFENGILIKSKSGDKYLFNLIKKGWKFGEGPFVKIPKGWCPNSGAAKLVIVDSEVATNKTHVHSGKYALMLQTGKNGCHIYTHGGQAGLYNVSFWAKGSGSISICLYFYIKAESGKSKFIKTSQILQQKLTPEWKCYNKTFQTKNLSANAVRFNLAIAAGKQSTVYIDDIKLINKQNNSQ